ncbi:hypothetical protein AMK59_1878 [Oryctes borbonicus]|uniref:Protein tyrosine phosphatase type IVA 3 n=1 Tax=Oryctes borbonicus TaxID=1629725 RepID=A0A0T6BA09_9SCAR|nr:hypothetical protein AMK59_1878 [Oryctes borbonicus]
MVQKIFALPPAEIQYKGFKFLITDQPTNQNMKNYMRELRKYNVLVVVRVCEAAYKVEELEKEGIQVFDLVYSDGSFPPRDVIDGWFELLRQHSIANPDAHVAIHCVAGLGRAPVLVALALMELGLSFEDAVEIIREKKRGAINSKQLDYLEKYRPKSRLKLKNTNASASC